MANVAQFLVAAAMVWACAAAHADVTVVEYYHSGFEHHFVTSGADEIAKLDARMPPFELWSRTGRTFRAYENSAARAGSVGICRFFNVSFAPKSSHFYAPHGLGCEDTVARFPDWQLEDDMSFAAMLPDANGDCPADTAPVYRLYNNGRGGAPNHRFVTSLADRQAMLEMGYVPEGTGIGVGMCVPAGTGRTTAEGFWRGVTSEGVAVRLVVLDDGRYYIVHSMPGGDEQGLVTGTFSYSEHFVVSRDVLVVPLTSRMYGMGTSITGTFSPASVLQLDLESSSVAVSYDASFDVAANVATLLGTYTGAAGHMNELGQPGSAIASIDADGKLSIQGVQCGFTGQLTARSTAHVFDTKLNGSGSCSALLGLHAILLYDAASRRLSVLTDVFVNPFYGFNDVFAMFGTRN